MAHAFAPDATLDIILVPASATSSAANVATAITKHAAKAQPCTSRCSRPASAAVTSLHPRRGSRDARGAATSLRSSHRAGRAGELLVALHGARRCRSTCPLRPAGARGRGTLLDTTPPAPTSRDGLNDNTKGSGGGYSSLFPRPSYQDSPARARATRASPMCPPTPTPTAPWRSSTATATPGHRHQLPASLWAGVIALADQKPPAPRLVNPAIYRIAAAPPTTGLPRRGHRRQLGRDRPGLTAQPDRSTRDRLGSPDAQYLVPLLAHAARSGA